LGKILGGKQLADKKGQHNEIFRKNRVTDFCCFRTVFKVNLGRSLQKNLAGSRMVEPGLSVMGWGYAPYNGTMLEPYFQLIGSSTILGWGLPQGTLMGVAVP